MHVNRNQEEVLSTVNRNQEEVLSTTTTTKRTQVCVCNGRKLRMIYRSWCRRVGEEYDSTMRTKTTIDRTTTIMATTTP
jgi:uncharacterized protein involved in tolerance to divalent cations